LSRAPDANRELLWQARSARLFIVAAVALGVLAATATVFQMGSLGRIVDQVFLKEADLADVRDLMLLLLGAVLARAALLLAQEVVAERGAAPDGSIIVATTSRFRTYEYRWRSKHVEVRSGLHPTAQ
jgi:ABC-type multidrug transport system fused ATPase/permease subunit